MLIISTVLYTAITIIFVPALIVLIYMMATNFKYTDIINVYGISNSGVGGVFTLLLIGYIFLMGLCAGDLPTIWTSTLFLVCLGASVAISIVICKILRFMNRDRIKYGNVMLADEEIQDKIILCSKQLDELQHTIRNSGFTPEIRETNENRLKELRETIGKLSQIHQELQQQKIMLNASLGANDLKNVVLSDGATTNKSLDRQIDRFNFNRSVNNSFRGVEDIMRKYKI